jgi:hypothetical protein
VFWRPALQVFSLQPELDQATTGTEPVAQRETTAAPSYGIGSLMQSHFSGIHVADSRDARKSSRNSRSEAIAKAVDEFCIRRYLARGGAGHPLPLWLEESSSLGSGGIFGRCAGESGLVVTSLFRLNARPRKPIAIKIAPPIISQCGNSIDESKLIYFPFAFSPSSTRRRMYPEGLAVRKRISLSGGADSPNQWGSASGANDGLLWALLSRFRGDATAPGVRSKTVPISASLLPASTISNNCFSSAFVHGLPKGTGLIGFALTVPSC